MELDRLYHLLKEKPRDARWLLRRVGEEYQDSIDALRSQGRPVDVRLQEVDGLHRAVYHATDQGELFPETPAAPRRRRRRRRVSW